MIGRLATAGLSTLLLAAPAGAVSPGDVAAAFVDSRQRQVAGADGVPLTVVDRGDPAAPAIVFIHGYRQSHLSWFAQFASTLSTHCHLVAYDLRGHGDSGAPWQREAYDRSAVWAIDLARVIEAVGARRPLIVAWSFGGLVAMDYLRDVGTDIAGVVFVGSTGQLSPLPARPAAPPQALVTRAISARASADAVYGGKVDPGVRALFASSSLRTGPFVDTATTGRMATLDNSDLLPKLRALPVTLVDGTDDPIVARGWTAEIKALLPGARIVEMQGAGHASFIDAAERFDALLDEIHCRR